MDDQLVPITIRILEVDRQYVLVESDYWGEMLELPFDYYKESIAKWHHLGNDNLLFIPIANITKIGFYNKKSFSFSDASWTHIGISSLLVSVLGILCPINDSDDEDEYAKSSFSERAIIGASAGFLIAAVGEPLYKYFKKNPKTGSKIHRNIESFKINGLNRLIVE